jgi:hypothetical protein
VSDVFVEYILLMEARLREPARATTATKLLVQARRSMRRRYGCWG